MVVVSHTIPTYATPPYSVNFHAPTYDIQMIIMQIFAWCGSIGNDIFIIISAYFLLDSKRINKSKVLHLYCDFFVIVCALLTLTYWNGSIRATAINVFKNGFLFFKGTYWFFTVYILIYLIHPLLNVAIESLNKRELLRVCTFGYLLFCCIALFTKSNLTNIFVKLIAFIILYFIVAYIKNYGKLFLCDNINQKVGTLLLSVFLFLSYIALYNVLGVEKNVSIAGLGFCNSIALFVSFSLFSVFCNIDIKSKIAGKIIPFIASLSLIVYLTHFNGYTLVMPLKMLKYIYAEYTYEYIGFWICGIFVVYFTVNVIIAGVYKLVFQKYCHKLFDYLCKPIHRIVEASLNALEKL